MLSVNPKPLVEVRCKNNVFLKDTGKNAGKPFICGRLLAKVVEGRGEIKCWHCAHLNKYEVVQA